MRKITVVSSDTQTKTTFETEATTVAELLDELDARDISYADKSLFEGISHTTIDINTEEAVLPHDNQYRGTVTNDLVIMITAGKKISSGMDRAAVYVEIKNRGLQQAILEAFGKNFTNLPTDVLIDFVTNQQDHNEFDDSGIGCPFADYFVAFVKFLLQKELIDPNSLLEVLHETGAISKVDEPKKEEVKSNFSDEEINDMFANLK